MAKRLNFNFKDVDNGRITGQEKIKYSFSDKLPDLSTEQFIDSIESLTLGEFDTATSVAVAKQCIEYLKKEFLTDMQSFKFCKSDYNASIKNSIASIEKKITNIKIELNKFDVMLNSNLSINIKNDINSTVEKKCAELTHLKSRLITLNQKLLEEKEE